MTFTLYSALVAAAGSAEDPQIRNEGTGLSAAIPTHSAESIGNVLDEMVHSCIRLDLFKAPAVGTPS
jgi:hypothetical protein